MDYKILKCNESNLSIELVDKWINNIINKYSYPIENNNLEFRLNITNLDIFNDINKYYMMTDFNMYRIYCIFHYDEIYLSYKNIIINPDDNSKYILDELINILKCKHDVFCLSNNINLIVKLKESYSLKRKYEENVSFPYNITIYNYNELNSVGYKIGIDYIYETLSLKYNNNNNTINFDILMNNGNSYKTRILLDIKYIPFDCDKDFNRIIRIMFSTPLIYESNDEFPIVFKITYTNSESTNCTTKQNTYIIDENQLNLLKINSIKSILFYMVYILINR